MSDKIYWSRSEFFLTWAYHLLLCCFSCFFFHNGAAFKFALPHKFTKRLKTWSLFMLIFFLSYSVFKSNNLN